MAEDRTYHHSHLFTVRLWSEEVLVGQRTADTATPSEWRGQVRHVFSGETRYFRDWSTLMTHLETLLSDCEPGPYPADTDS